MFKVISRKPVEKTETDLFMAQTDHRLLIDGIQIPRGSILGFDSESKFAVTDRDIYYVSTDDGLKPAVHVVRFYDNRKPKDVLVYDCKLSHKILHNYADEDFERLYLGMKKKPRKELTLYEESIRETKRLMRIHAKPHTRMGNSWNGWE